jgi:predicted flap endonuclease-1-like 5' DNA nuclease
MVSIFTLLPEYQADKVEPEAAPRMLVGAASPLWLMFGGAAAAGAAYWWWASRWREAVNLEALMGLAAEPVAPPVESVAILEAAPAPVVEAVAVAAVAATVLDAVEEVAVAAAEPLVETVAATNEDIAEAVVETVAEPVAAEPAVIAVEAAAPVVEAAAETVVEAVEAAPEAIVETVKAAADDLTRIVGVGPKLAASLADLGVTTFSQMAAWTPDELASFDELLNLKGRADRDAWIAQAKRFAAPVEA